MSDDRFAESNDVSPSDISLPGPHDPADVALDPPAPIIDLGGEAMGRPDRPLGPRRLALLQEQMARHQREIAEAQPGDPTRVDPELAQKQRRMAELASRAAVSSPEDRQLAEDAIAQTQSIAPITDDHPPRGESVPCQDEADPETEPGAQNPEQTEELDEPSAPVRAVDAQGLQLMEPEAYRSSAGWRTGLLATTAVLVLAAVILLIILLL